jgi:hypothetical protein
MTYILANGEGSAIRGKSETDATDQKVERGVTMN